MLACSEEASDPARDFLFQPVDLGLGGFQLEGPLLLLLFVEGELLRVLFCQELRLFGDGFFFGEHKFVYDFGL